MKKILLLVLSFYAVSVFAAVPQTEYFRAMQDEISRTNQDLRLKGHPKPFFTAYKMDEFRTERYMASLGELVESPKGLNPFRRILSVHMIVGDARENSNGFDNNRYYFQPTRQQFVADNYDGLRQSFWIASDQEYSVMLDTYAQKETYKRQKNLDKSTPDFAKAQPAYYNEEVAELASNRMYYEGLVKKLSALGKDYPRVEKSVVSINLRQEIIRYINNEGAWYQKGATWAEIVVAAQSRNKDGYKSMPSVSFVYSLKTLPSEAELAKKTESFFEGIEQSYNAKKGEPYLGPVLFKNRAAAGFLERLFVQNVRHSKPLLSANNQDRSVGGFKDKKGQRVISNLFDVTDRPLLREYNAETLFGFMPVDDEGVSAQELVLVKNGKLVDLPTTRNLSKGEKASNGHARMSFYSKPNSALTSVFFTPKEGLPADELEQKLLSRCRELDLEYCYVVDSLGMPGSDFSPSAQKIYVKDGRKEPVYGLKFQNLNPRSLRDISAAGNDETVFNYYDDDRIPRTMVTPSVIVEEVELVPDDAQPDRAPFVSQPR